MESSALAGLSRLMGHKAMTVCMVIANRLIKEANTGYKNTIDTLIKQYSTVSKYPSRNAPPFPSANPRSRV